jgi:hypothetical protein
MTEAELIQLINKKRYELEYNRSSKVSHSLLRVQEEELEELEEIFATNDAVRMAKRVFVDQCQEKVDETVRVN